MSDCIYCGEQEAVMYIDDPNGVGDEWHVCAMCSQVISAQKEMSFLWTMKCVMSKELPEGHDILVELDSKIKDIQDNLPDDAIYISLKKKEVSE